MLAAPSAAAPSLTAAAAAAAKPPRTPTLALHRTLLHASSSAAPSAAPAPSSRQPVPASPRPPAKRPHGARPTRRASKRTSPSGSSSSSSSSSNGNSSASSRKASGATQSGTPTSAARPVPAMQGTSTRKSTSAAATSGPTSSTMAPRPTATNATAPAQTPAAAPVVRAPATDDAREAMPHATAAVATSKTTLSTTTAPTRDHVTLPAPALPTPAASYAVVAPKQQEPAPVSKTCSSSMTTSYLMASPPQSPVLTAAPAPLLPAPTTLNSAAPAKDGAIPALALAHEVPTAPKLAAASIPTPPAVEHAHPLLWAPSSSSSSSSASPLPKPTRALSTASDASSDLASTARIAPLAKPAATAISAPRRLHLGDFQLLETLGTGTFGRVHLARHRSATSQYYAMKVLAKTDVVRLKQVAHINSERAILARVHHPFLVNMVATFHDARNLYMLLEYVSGGELFTYLRRVGRLHPNAARFYAAEIVTAIEHLHAREITYRDLKPENLLIDAQGHIKITDFGFAKVVPDRTWTLCGTPEYLAPEIIKGTGHGKAVDWWSLGILIFELLCGYPPFYDDSPYGIYEKILAGRLQFPAFVDAAARDLIRNLLAHDWTKRLGALKGGASDIKNHRWFANIDWDELVARRVTPPMVPRVHGPGDTNNFEKYPEPDPHALAPCWTAPDHYGHLFPDF
ncbi:AGC/PKA protein kinase [Allomyces macrogynus ATCC 38327]|uniref:cAMP-dependent protein kinase n=1 Tax=Allomyces macrogynus (strain ATCC 38327) TaxID=578462 RepID=A0A0L0SRA6_ALLM3|nr:AGC/PKA protein kinase [Allomyces macrogynus ATCC 38327]|eukprot:KNE65047.1 AGC/PKA protein kinase [Allomyces macrogynus ATCC 38327]